MPSSTDQLCKDSSATTSRAASTISPDHDSPKSSCDYSSRSASSRSSLDIRPEGPVKSEASPSVIEAARTEPDTTPYSIFTINQKRFVVCLAAMGAFFSAISANIYFPALNPIATQFNVSPALINLTLTGYQIFQGIAPLIIGDLADQAGRRPAYIFCFVVYIGANIGLALCPNFVALMVLRCMQSSGSAPTIALASGVVADIADSSERGSWMGIATSFSNIAPALGPVLGGLIAQYLGWRYIFWFLVLIAGAYLVVFGVFFPETSRNVVGNGSLAPGNLNKSLSYYIREKRGMQQPETHEQQDIPEKRRLRFPNPLTGLKLLAEKDIGLILVCNALLFSLWYCTMSTTPYLFAKLYNFDELQIGLCYLPLGVGALISPVINGKILDWNFRRTAAKFGGHIDRKRASSMKEFPLERARLSVIMPFMFATIVLNFIYGWIMHFHAPLPAALVLQFFIGVTNTATFAGMNCFLTDLYPQGPSTVIAANNLCRCWVAAGVTAAIVPAVEAMGVGGAFSLFAGMLMLSTPMSLLLIKKGPEWRTERKDRLAKKAEIGRQSRLKASISESTISNEK